MALSVLGNNNASLIGVAISASLLPPAVNCGITLAFALVESLSVTLNSQSSINRSSNSSFSSGDFLMLGALSLALTLVNIAAIFLAALSLFRLKEVAPVVNKVAFWNEDVKLCRGLNRQQKRLVAQRLLLKKKRVELALQQAPSRVGSSNFLPFSSSPSSTLSTSAPSFDFSSSPHHRGYAFSPPSTGHPCFHHHDLAADSDSSSGQESESCGCTGRRRVQAGILSRMRRHVAHSDDVTHDDNCEAQGNNYSASNYDNVSVDL